MDGYLIIKQIVFIQPLQIKHQRLMSNDRNDVHYIINILLIRKREAYSTIDLQGKEQQKGIYIMLFLYKQQLA